MLLGTTFITDSRALCDDHTHYWLILTPHEEHTEKEFATLLDFGKEIPFEIANAYLREHGKPLCDSKAIQTLGALI